MVDMILLHKVITRTSSFLVEHHHQIAPTHKKLLKTAKVKYGVKVAESLRNNFYVNEMLKSVSNEQTAIKLM